MKAYPVHTIPKDTWGKPKGFDSGKYAVMPNWSYHHCVVRHNWEVQNDRMTCPTCDAELSRFNKYNLTNQGDMTMNYSTAILVVNDSCRAITVAYEATEGASTKIFKTFDKSIKPGDYVVVPSSTRHKMTTSKVIAVDVDSWVGSSQQIDWVLGRIDLEDANRIKEFEEAAIVAMKNAEKLKQRRELRASMEAAMADGDDAMKLLSTSPADISSAPALEVTEDVLGSKA